MLAFSFIVVSAFSQQQLVELDANKVTTLEEAILELEGNYGFLFSYRQDDIQNIKISIIPPKASINTFLKSLLKDKELAFEIVNNNYIILTKKRQEELPKGLLLCGKVLDSLSQSPLAYANVYLKNSRKGTTSLKDGSFQFRAEFDETDTLVLSYVGYEEKHLAAIHFNKKNCPTIELNYYNFGEDFIIVTDYLTDGIQLYDNGASIELQPNLIGALPGQVEPDILQTIQFLPGISSQDGTPSAICIQGGTPDQNLILWEDIPIYHSAHYFGMLSAFNPYIIDRVRVYKGGFGAKYGGRISGVIDMKSDVVKTKKPKISIGTNLIFANVDGHFSLLEDKLSVVYSLRRSLTEILRTPTFENITKRIQQGILVQNIDLNRIPPDISIKDDFSFFDTNLKTTFRPSEKDQFSMAIVYAESDFADEILDNRKMQKQADTLILENVGLNLSWVHNWKPGFSTKLIGVHTNYHYDYVYELRSINQMNKEKFGVKKSSIEEQQINLINTYQTSKKHEIEFGYQLANYDVAYQITRNRNNDQVDETRDFNSNLHVLHAAFNSTKEQPYGFDIGLRLSHFGEERNQYFEPRIRLWYQLPDKLNVYLNAGRYYQFLSQLIEIEGDRASIETPVWTLTGTNKVPVLSSTQFQLGLIYRKKSWLFDIQAYAKRIDGLSSLATGFEEGLSGRFHIGMADVKGIDFLIKKRWKKYQSWISYSLSNNVYKFNTFFDREFQAPIDQRHAFNWANMWSLGNFDFSLGWKICSGRPYSDLENFEVRPSEPGNPSSGETIFPRVNLFNSARLPAEHQLDASILYNFFPKIKNTWKGVIGISFYNIYHQRNIYNRSFYIRKPMGEPSFLEYADKSNMGFTTNFVFRIELY